MSEPGLFETMGTMRAMRRLKPDPVPLDVIRKILESGTQAPSGQNTQPWPRWVISPATRPARTAAGRSSSWPSEHDRTWRRP